MSDIVERLRGPQPFTGGFQAECYALREEAADSIERLRASNADLLAAAKAYNAWADPTECHGDPELRQVREQIRAAIAKADALRQAEAPHGP
jgi:hypothetical protein